MSNESGIISQFGFYFQKLVFVRHILNKISRDGIYVYEGIEDISDDEKIDEEENNLVSFKSKDLEDIQVKSGKITKQIWIKVIENWILLNNDHQKILFSENDLAIDTDSDQMIEAIFQNIKDGQNKRETAISKQAFDELSQRNNDESEWKEIIKNLVNEAQIVVRSSSQVEKEIEDLYTSTYCTDIYTYEKAKKLRSDRFKETCFARIDAAISKKNKQYFHIKI